MLAGSCSWIAVNKCQNRTAKVAKKAFNMGWFRTQYVAMVTELLGAYRRAHLVESYRKVSKISDTNWLNYLFSSLWYFNKIWWSVWRHHLANLHIIFKKLKFLWNEKRYLKTVNRIFLLMKSTCLCFKMG